MEAQKWWRFVVKVPSQRWLLRSNPEVERMELEDMMVSFDKVGPENQLEVGLWNMMK